MFNVSFPGLGIELTVNSVLFSSGGITIRWYGVLIAIGMALAILYCSNRSKLFGVSSDKLLSCVLGGMVLGIIGARLYFVIFKWDYYSQHLNEIFAINEGGLAFYGGLIGGIGGGLLVARFNKTNIPALLDLAGMGYFIGQAFGRWGNFANQEAFGTETSLPWRMVSENTGGVGVHPCFLYESIWCALGFVLLHFLTKKRKYDGQLFLVYLAWYGFERMIVEGLRTDSLYIPNTEIRISQAVSALVLLVSVIILIVNHVKKKDTLAVKTLRDETGKKEMALDGKTN